MYFFFSGEGVTDLGTSNDKPGPLALVADQIIAEHHHYSFLKSCAVFVHPAELEQIKPQLRTAPRSPGLRGLKTPAENRLHRKDAAALAYTATSHIRTKEDKEFVAVLFRDSNSPDEKEWNDKRNSMLNGFRDQAIEGRGVAAVARPISEAWWLNALDRKANPNRIGKKYDEMRRGGNEGDHRLKKELGEDGQRVALVKMVENEEIDYKLIDSESFLAFRRDFETAVGLEHLYYTKATP